MPPSDQPTSLRQTLFRLHGVTVGVADGTTLGPIDWVLERGRRIVVESIGEEQWAALVALLTGQRTPAAGRLEEVRPVTVQTDTHVREHLNLNRTLQEWLESPDAPEFVWLEGRRRSLGVLVDLLGISPAMTRRALRYTTPAVQDKAWALRFLLSRANLLLGRAIFQLDDAQVREALRRRWGDWSGTLLAAPDAQSLPGPADGWLRFDDQGRFSAGDVPRSAEDGEAAASGTDPRADDAR